MTRTQQYFLNALKQSLYGKSVAWKNNDFDEDMFFFYANSQYVLPMICEALWEWKGRKKLKHYEAYRDEAVSLTVSQIIKTECFLGLYEVLIKEGITPVVIKGSSLRDMYPWPYHRLSQDEDLFILTADQDKCHELLKLHGFGPLSSGESYPGNFEVSYVEDETKTFIEIHKCLFDPENIPFGNWNRFFDNYRMNLTRTKIFHPSDVRKENPVDLYTMDCTDHLFYMICHALKHFIYTGFGFRHITDMILYAEKYHDRINWEKLWDNCEKIRAVSFTKVVFLIGRKYFLQNNSPIIPYIDSLDCSVPIEPLVEDIFKGGLYGDSSLSRSHSSNMVLDYYSKSTSGKREKRNILAGAARSVFLPVDRLKGRYPFLNKYPVLLPFAWVARIVGYLSELKTTDKNDSRVTDTLKIAEERIRLLEKYEIV